MQTIKRWDTDRVIYDHGHEASDREVVEAAVVAGVNLFRANLAHANLDGASLAHARLDGANLAHASLDPIRGDIYDILSAAPVEVPALLTALRAGKIDGSTYSGECACLVGTIANARGCDSSEIVGIVPDASRPAERWFLAIRPGITPENHPVARITEQWIEQWLSEHPVAS